MFRPFRSLFKAPAFGALAIGTLALGIGANTLLFSVINTLFLRPLAYPEPDRLVRVWGSFPQAGLDQAGLSWPRYLALREEAEAFSELAAQTFSGFTLTGTGEPEQLQGMRVTANFLPTLELQPAVGRGFSAAEDAPGGADVVLLSHGFWQRRFGGTRDIVGQVIQLNGRPHTVVGILPPQLGFPFAQAQVWVPRVFDQEGLTMDLVQRGTGYLQVLGRLAPGANLEQAVEQLKVVSARYGRVQPDKVDATAGIAALPLQEDLVGNQRPMALTLLGAVGCVLLVACANVANLLLARFTGRRKEIAIRIALGASRRRVVGEQLAESLVLALLAGAGGVLLAIWGLDVLVRLAAEVIPRAPELALDLRVLSFTLVLAGVTGLALGIIPAAHAARVDPMGALKDGSRGTSAGPLAGRMRAALLVGEIALSLVLLVGAGLLLDSFRRLQDVDPGFRTEGVATFNLTLPFTTYPTEAEQARLHEKVLAGITNLPGVERAATTSSPPGAIDGFSRSPVAREGEALPPITERRLIPRSTVSPGFFATLDIPLLRGRDFTWRDRLGSREVVIINAALARALFGEQDPIGHRLITGIGSIPREVVGVVGDVRSLGLDQPPMEEMYYPCMQVDGLFQTVLVRSHRAAGSLRAELAAAVHAVDAGLPVAEVESYSSVIAAGWANRQLLLVLLGAFAALALILAAMGIYSVIAYTVVQRTAEFGIRMALGAAPQQVIHLVMKEGLRLAAGGAALGLLLAVLLSRLLRGLLFEVSPADGRVYFLVTTFVLIVAALACLLPARRATRVDPLTALRSE